jgi:hypothetical protein
MKWILRSFAVLDVLSLFFLFDNFLLQFQSILTNEPLTSIEFLSRISYIITYFSLLVGAIFLAIPKKAGIIIYYCQIPLRVMFSVFTLGYISILSTYSNWEHIQNVLIAGVIFLEMLRIYYSYIIQTKLFKK